MRGLFPIIAGCAFVITSCGKSPIQSERVEQANADQPELAPHFRGTNFVYVGDFFGNHAYIQLNDGGNMSSALADGHFVASVVTARESTIMLFQNPKTGEVAVLDPSNPESAKKTASDLKFAAISPETPPGKAWARASNPSAFVSDKKKGRSQEWIYVDMATTDRQIDSFYVSTEIKTEAKSGLRYVPILGITEERFMFYLDPKNNKFAPVRNDLFWTPKEEMKYREITAGGVAEAVLKLVTSRIK